MMPPTVTLCLLLCTVFTAFIKSEAGPQKYKANPNYSRRLRWRHRMMRRTRREGEEESDVREVINQNSCTEELMRR